MRRILIIILLTASVLYAAEKRLSWTPVEGAWGYYIEIRGADGAIVVQETINTSYYDISKLEPGSYSFRISSVNILKQKGESTDWIDFDVEQLFVPELKSISRSELVAKINNRNIIIRGTNFKPQSRFLLRGKGMEIALDDVDIRSETEVSINFKPSVSQKGIYDLAVINRGDVEAVLKGAVTIVEPEEAKSVWYAGAVYSVNIPMSDFTDYFATSYTGGGVYLQMSATKYGFENFLIDIEADAVRFVNTADTKKSSLTQISLGLGLGYLYPVPASPVELVLRFHAGPVYTSLTMDENITGKNVSSTDVFAMLGAGVRYYSWGNFYIEPSVGWKTVFYTGTFFNDVYVSLGLGMRF